MNKKTVYYLIFLSIFFLDRITKYFALTHLMGHYEATSFLSFDLLFNRGISWGMFHSHSTTQFILVTSFITGIILILTLFTYTRYQERALIVGEIMVLSGAWSNLYDRMVYQGVIDFIAVNFGDWAFPVFNIADACIVLGVALMVYIHIKEG